jgi:hypothetical protein
MVEDAIQGWISMEKERLHPALSSIILRGIQTTIRIMEKTPRDLVKVQLLIDQKEAALHKTDSIEKRDALREEVNALEWLRMLLTSSDRERETWACLAVHSRSSLSLV